MSKYFNGFETRHFHKLRRPERGRIIFWTISFKIGHSELYTINKWHELEQRNKESNPLWPSKLVASCLSWFGGSSRSGPAELRGHLPLPPDFIYSNRKGRGQIMPTTLLLTPFQIFKPSAGSHVFVNIHASSKRLFTMMVILITP